MVSGLQHGRSAETTAVSLLTSGRIWTYGDSLSKNADIMLVRHLICLPILHQTAMQDLVTDKPIDAQMKILGGGRAFRYRAQNLSRDHLTGVVHRWLSAVQIDADCRIVIAHAERSIWRIPQRGNAGILVCFSPVWSFDTFHAHIRNITFIGRGKQQCREAEGFLAVRA